MLMNGEAVPVLRGTMCLQIEMCFCVIILVPFLPKGGNTFPLYVCV